VVWGKDVPVPRPSKYNEDFRRDAVELVRSSGRTLRDVPRCFNAPEQAGEVAKYLDAIFGPDNVARDLRATGSEDVGWLADAIGVPLVFWMFGAYRPGRDPGDMPSNHTPKFAPEPEYAIPAGVRAALAALGTRLDVPSQGGTA
jgi:hippurate hydrolase